MALSVHIRKKLKDFTLAIDYEMDGEITGVLGSSGCGKSMTLKCIAGIETPDEGRIVLDGKVLFDSEAHINLPPQKRRVGYLFQSYALFPNMTVRQNVEAGLAAVKKSRQEKAARTAELLEKFHIKELENAYPSRISGGQQQRVALARMMAAEPELLLLDEPFSALDAYLKEKLMQDMKTYLGEFKKGVLLVSHSRDEVYQMCTHTAVMHAGCLEAWGETDAFFKNPGTVHGALLTGCKNISRAVPCALPSFVAEKQRKELHCVYAKDWGVHLLVEGVLPEDFSHVGIRAHDLRPELPSEGNNRMRCRLRRISEAPFEVYLILENADYPEGTPLWWKVPKGDWERMGEKIPEEIYFPPEKINILSKSANRKDSESI